MINKEDLFYKLVNEGKLIHSSLDFDFNSVRVIEFQGKRFRLTLGVED